MFLFERVLVVPRRPITAVISTSLKVGSWAAVFWDSFRRSAMVLRNRVIATFSSRASLWREPEGTAATGCGALDRAASAPSMSPLVTRPSLPVPATEDTAIPDSSATLLKDYFEESLMFHREDILKPGDWIISWRSTDHPSFTSGTIRPNSW
jgi:hypothetical protein